MKMMKWIGWCGVVLLVASLMWTTGCGGSDGDDGTTTVVVTNASGDTTTVVVTNEPAAPADPAAQALGAPQLVTPENNKTYKVFLLNGAKKAVNFEWTGVAGAASYVLEMNGDQFEVSGTIHSFLLDYGEYKWHVWAEDADGAEGPVSPEFTVTISPFTLDP